MFPPAPDPPGMQDQPIDIALLEAIMIADGDPDSGVMQQYKVGVPLGVQG